MVKTRKPASKRRNGLQALTLCISTAMVLILLGVVVLSVLSARNLTKLVKENLIVTMMLEDEMTQPESQELVKSLKQKRYVSSLEFISKEQALEENKKAMGSDPTEFIGTNPFLASIEFHLASEYANSDSLVWIQKELQRYPKISEITYQKDLVDSVNRNLERISIVLLVLAGLLTFVSFSLINNTVRLGVYSRRFNIHTMKLVGASRSFIRAPFLRQSIVVGIFAAILADAVIGGCLYMLYMYQPDMLDVITPEVMGITGASVFLFGLIITGICTFISVNKFLKMKAGELYKI